MLHNTIVLPLFDYCSPVRDSFGVGSKAYLDKLNRRGACIIKSRSIGADEFKADPAYKRAEIIWSAS